MTCPYSQGEEVTSMKKLTVRRLEPVKTSAAAPCSAAASA
jgi:hypothetical protein